MQLITYLAIGSTALLAALTVASLVLHRRHMAAYTQLKCDLSARDESNARLTAELAEIKESASQASGLLIAARLLCKMLREEDRIQNSDTLEIVTTFETEAKKHAALLDRHLT